MARHGGEIDRTARDALGIEELRPGQREAIEAVLDGRDTLAVMSTGYGKSAIYQVAGLLIEGATIVVSPLIALQRDQVESIEEELPGEAGRVASDVSASERKRALEQAGADELEFLFLSPEQLANPEVLRQVAAAEPSLLVVDEAHCISEWGHDFRPDYLRLGAFAERLGRPRILALTATASPPVREEITERLSMRDPAVVVRGFDRPNIRLAVERHTHQPTKEQAIVEAVRDAPKPGLVYVATRKGAEELAERLAGEGVSAAAYHAGLGSSERDDLQNRFMDGEVEVIVATTAFGMGIDKADVRFVHHAEISESIDSYYQEIGRAGRDDKPAEAILFFRPEDQGIRRFFAGGGQIDAADVSAVAQVIAHAPEPVDPPDLREELDLSETKLLSAINRLEEAGAVELRADGRVEPCEDGPDLATAVEQAVEADEERHAFEQSRLEMMRGYADHTGCRREFILSYFGEAFEAPCGNCDNCLAGTVEAVAEEDRPFDVGSRVEHDSWGEGEVQRYDEGQVVVLFDSVGYKTLGLELVEERGLLSQV